MKQILVAVDGSESSERVVRFAARLAPALGAHLTLMHVVLPAFVPPEPYAVNATEIIDAAQRYGESVTARAVELAREQGVPSSGVVVVGAPAELLIEAAQSPDVELVVVGSHNRGAFARALLGSVSTRVVHLAAKPVLVVP